MVSWLVPVVITAADIYALWEISPDNRHGTRYLLQNLKEQESQRKRETIASEKSQLITETIQPLAPELRAGIHPPNRPIVRWRKLAHAGASAVGNISGVGNADTGIESSVSSINSTNRMFGINTISVGGDAVADTGAVVTAAVLSRSVTAPFERLKIVLQAGAFSSPPPTNLRLGSRIVFRVLLQLDGFRLALFRANALNALRSIPVAVSQFTSFQLFSSLLVDYKHVFKFSHQTNVALAAGFAGIISVSLTHPLDLLRTRVALMHSYPLNAATIPTSFTSSLRPATSVTILIRDIISNEGGVRGLYRGFGLSLAGIVPYLASSFLLYDTLTLVHIQRQQQKQQMQKQKAVSIDSLAIAATSAAVAQSATFPFDLIRRRLMVEGLNVRIGLRQRSAWAIFLGIIKHDGVAGLYSGIIPNLVKVVPATAVSMVIHDMFSRH
ncbi:hypothetical protein HK100_008863 [Physocladia obscura]|uniref:Mitochondrial carrier protein n=1 Tax=Physocladia obscura TaxID=109957 RepID=A0AAD5XHV0_9FUNG|nr:hypothetical protein HK100_008863 [Physocladia obscura]